MWFLLRLIFAGLMAFIRYRWRNQSVDGTESWQNELFYRRGTRRGEIQWGLGFDRPLVFELLLEHRSDRWFKNLGLLVEQQTGDVGFDNRIYIRSDQPLLGQTLSADSAARSAIQALFDVGVKRIYSDGVRLWAESSSPLAAKIELFLELRALRSRLMAINASALVRTPNPMSWRIAAAEAFAWGIAAYAIAGLVELIRVGEFSRDATRLISYTAITVLMLGFASAGVLVLLLRRSSWAKKVFWEAGLLLGVTIPIASATVVLDANRLLDQSPLHSSYYQVVERRAHPYYRMGRGRHTTAMEYMVRVQPVKSGDPVVRRWLSVSRESYEDKSAGLEIVWGDGALGFPWIYSSRPALGNMAAEDRR